MRAHLFTAFLGILPLAADAEIYRCESDDGTTLFSERPCGKDAEEIRLTDYNAGISIGPQGDFSKVRTANTARELRRRIARKEDYIEDIELERDERIRALKKQQDKVADDLIGATREQSLATEMKAIADNFNTRIGLELDDIRVLRNKLRSLDTN